MAWHGALTLAYRRDELRGAPRTVLHDRHDGPLRVLASLYPEGDSICHNVLVHPPGGLVAGDALTIDVTLGTDAHALITTPGATRFYRSTGAPAKRRSPPARGSNGCRWRRSRTAAASPRTGCASSSRRAPR
jgi:urease accessory protein